MSSGALQLYRSWMPVLRRRADALALLRREVEPEQHAVLRLGEDDVVVLGSMAA
jgi:hypothetical protein